MSYFNSLTLTTKGQEILLSSNTNIDKIITFTNASLGSEKLLPEEIKGATEIKSSWLKVPLNSVRIINDESNYFLRAEIAFTNIGITESKIMRELGIYAKFESEEEVLFAYSITDDDGETIPKEDIVPATYKFTIDTTLSTETKINQVINPEGFLTKEVIELLKENIRNIAFRKIQGTLSANQRVIQVPLDILLPISERAILQIEGEIYFLGRDYTIDIHANTIILNNRYSFEEGIQYEIIDPLPATYVKEQIQEFIDEFKKLVSDSKINFDKFKDEIYLEFQGKIDSFYLEVNEYIEQNKEILKGHSIDRIIENGKDENGGNIYDIFRDDEKKIGTIVAPRGPRGNGIVNPEFVGYTENGDTQYVLVLEDGRKTINKIISPRGQDGMPFYFAKVYSSIVEMEADFVTDSVDFGEYVVISSNDNDNAKLFEKRSEGFFFIIQIAMSGANFLTLEFVRFDDEGNTIVKSKNSKGELGNEILIKRGPRGYTGGTVGGGELPPPTGANYGDKKEWAGSYVPDGWALCNGGTLSGKKYPHLIGLLDYISEPTEVKYKFVDNKTAISGGAIGNGNYPSKQITCGEKVFKSIYFRGKNSDYSLNNGTFYSMHTSRYIITGASKYITVPDNSPTYCMGFISEISLDDSFFYPKAIALDGANHEFGGILPDEDGNNGGINKNLHPDIYFNIEYIDENGDWRLGYQLHNKTDFVKSTILDNMYIGEIKTTFKTKKIRLSIAPKSTPHYPTQNYYYLGRFHTYLDDISNRDLTVIKLPDEKDSSGKYKLVYIGQPLEVQEPGIYSYSRDNILNGEVPFSLAAENKLPNYSEGITMAEPKEFKMGYINRYNNKSDSWELIKTHDNQQGYYYNNLGDLKYTTKPNNYSIWDFKTNSWVEDTLLKEKVKKEILDKYIELEIKKDKMIDLEIDTTSIIEKIKKIKKNLENLNA